MNEQPIVPLGKEQLSLSAKRSRRPKYQPNRNPLLLNLRSEQFEINFYKDIDPQMMTDIIDMVLNHD